MCPFLCSCHPCRYCAAPCSTICFLPILVRTLSVTHQPWLVWSRPLCRCNLYTHCIWVRWACKLTTNQQDHDLTRTLVSCLCGGGTLNTWASAEGMTALYYAIQFCFQSCIESIMLQKFVAYFCEVWNRLWILWMTGFKLHYLTQFLTCSWHIASNTLAHKMATCQGMPNCDEYYCCQNQEAPYVLYESTRHHIHNFPFSISQNLIYLEMFQRFFQFWDNWGYCTSRVKPAASSTIMSMLYKSLVSTILSRLYPLKAIFKCHESFISINDHIAKEKNTQKGA